MIKRMLLLASTLTLACSGPTKAADVASGLQAARKLCVNCHIVEPGGAAEKKEVTAGVPTFMAAAAKPGQSEEKLKAFMLNPHPPMPQVQLTTHELDNIAAYIMSLKTGN
jgi:mono/diheme cytochrome c family protein